MKASLKYILATLISLCAYQTVLAGCGAMNYTIPAPSFFHIKIADVNKERENENLLLWQSQTSQNIKLEDFRDVIYGDALSDNSNDIWWNYSGEDEELKWDNGFDEGNTTDTFINYLNNSQDGEAYNFIMLAKHLAKLRADRNSPWYYPESKYEINSGFDGVINTIEAYKGKRFYNRYSLQLIRALFASRKYEECIEAYDNRFGNVPDTDLMKQMARDYVAGAAARIGNDELSIDYFATTGDVESLSRFLLPEKEAFELAAMTSPDSPKLLKFISQKINGKFEELMNPSPSDSLFVKETLIPVATKVVAPKKADKQLWHYILAVCGRV